MNNSFITILEKYRKIAFSERDKGDRFERLMKAYLLTDPKYAYKFKKVWLWNEFPSRNDLGGNDTGIDLVTITNEGDYWAIQCKCFQEGAIIDKKAIDTFFATSGREFKDENLKTTRFSQRLWIDTTGKPFSTNAEETFRNQTIPSIRLGLYQLINAPIDWEKLEKGISGEAARTSKKLIRPHQTEALTLTNNHFKENDRGKLIMACGTGKTFTALRIAENETQGKGLILFLVPSIALLGQTLNEWFADAVVPINAICICSDPEITKKRKQAEDIDTSSVVDLAFPASTNVESILNQFKYLETNTNKGLTVVFSTYQSIERIAQAQRALEKDLASPFGGNNGGFDLIICDEAHRTTGVSLADEDESAFTKVHSNDFIKAKKRLYMTATPRLYSDETKSKASQADAVLCSMDDESLYGQEIYRIGFGQAVEDGLLSDYKVLILTLNENDVSPAVQKMIMDKESEINADDASKLIGCINALSKQILGDEGLIKETDPEPMQRAVAFCASIVASKKITSTFNITSETYIADLPKAAQAKMQMVASKHIDGTMNATERDELLTWLKAEPAEKECRVLTNVRCLSEGVDVPNLDAVLFLSARNSQVDVVQSVGRVMRKADNKEYGYIIIPIVVPSNIEPEKALDDNERYKVVWTVLNALRAHDDRFNATVNKIELNRNRPTQILVGGTEYGFDGEGNPIKKTDGDGATNQAEIARQLSVQFQDLQSVVFARMVQKVGDKRYWEQWAKSVAEIATRQSIRITKLITEDAQHQKEFDNFLKGLHKNINPSITQAEAIEMLSQHIITKPVFDALFENYSFVQNNPMSQAMQKMLNLLEEQAFEKDAETLDKFYVSVKQRASGIDNAEGKQRIIIELYDKFFKTAFPKMVEKLGIVYTPVEVVDFIIHSVADILQKEFGRNISDENVHILDPFTGTGTFITRLLQSGLINKEDLLRKYTQEIHCNEIVLLAYYIAAINIENTFHDIQNHGYERQTYKHLQLQTENSFIVNEPEVEYKTQKKYISFEGICLTDTFQLGETDEGDKLFSDMFPQNSERVERQQKAPLRIIMGNPPYSIGQKSANDNAQNQAYPILDKRIADTYSKFSQAVNNKSLYDGYIKAFRWSADRLDKTGGIICFVSNGAWLDGNSTDGFRKAIEKEFTSIYVFNLRGNQRTSGELSRKEGGKIFGSGSRTPISITLLVKNPDLKTEKAIIHYHNVGEYLTREEKLKIVSNFKTFSNLKLTTLQPNPQGDWISMRNDAFDNFIPLQDKNQSIFNFVTLGVGSNRDAWVYNFSKAELQKKIISTLEVYNKHLKIENVTKENINEKIDDNPKLISWSRGLKNDLLRKIKIEYSANYNRVVLYRPFTKLNHYFEKNLNEYLYQMPRIFPKNSHNNLLINITGAGSTKDFSVLISDCLVDMQTLSNEQCFPLYYYEENKATQKGMFDDGITDEYIRRDAISDFILDRAKKLYGKNVIKEDIFYYVYGFLHSKEYREMFANDLKKMLPRLPLVEETKDFWAFSKAGRSLAELHLNYENIAPYKAAIVLINPLSITDTLKQANKSELEYLHYRVDKMRFPKKNQKETIIYNNQITIDNIPAKVYEYVVNGKSAIEWIMERYQVSKHKESGITNNPNDWSEEVNNPKYILNLLLSVINVSVQTVDIVNGLPKVNFE